MYTLRTRIKKDIVCEFVAPTKKSNKVIIVCGGMPGYPGRNSELLSWLAKKGYWAFLPRYRGSWESGGKFLKVSPHQDVLDVIDALPKGFKDLWSGKNLKIKNPQVYLIGSSFGGTAVLLASKNSKVKKVIALSPVIDWREEDKNTIEPIDFLAKFTKEAFGDGYRITNDGWKKLKGGNFFNPITEIKKFEAKKIFIIYAKNDKVVSSKTTKKFVEQLNCKSIVLNKGGHLSLSKNIPDFWPKIKKFFD